MKVLNFCLSLTPNSTVHSTSLTFEQLYQKIYKKLISFLYQDSSAKFTFAFDGPQLEWFEKEHPEFLQILHELVARKQIEVLGGGYYNPVFPLLSPVDRTGQIELLTVELRRITGKRPRGISVLSSVWDRSLVPGFQNCGMEWIFLDSSIIPEKSRHFLPQILGEQGKTLKVLPVYRNLKQALEKGQSPEQYLAEVFEQVESTVKDDEYSQYTQERVISVNMDINTADLLLAQNWIEALYRAAESSFSEKIRFCLPTEYIHRAEEFIPSFVESGFQKDVARWAFAPYQISDEKSGFPVSINNFLLTYPKCRSLYNRSLYISMLISNCHGDKARKMAARKSLWKAQSGDVYLCSPEGIFAESRMRQNAYKKLSEAEKYLREAAPFKESVAAFDYNADGHNEYLCSMENYTACISPRGGQVCELNVMHSFTNYSNNLSRVEKFDGADDGYERGLFVEHVFNREEFSDYKKGLPAGCGVFSKALFKEIGFNGTKKEVKLKGEGSFSSLALPISLRKRFLINSSGFTVQYILKNEGPIAFKGNFVVESNFAQTDFSSVDNPSYKLDLISGGNGITCEKAEGSIIEKDISFVQITDIATDVSFVYEPNEESGIVCRPLIFKRPCINSSVPQVSENTFTVSLFWEFDLAGGMEIEKTINFTVVTPKKRKVKKLQK
ncbi:MAG: DUF1926 domain-containing protein [Spirochaetia bacterium]|nr:DUF1926 domain-containing protein [Spirochaetia bacterium]